jgi:hypothetical protein
MQRTLRERPIWNGGWCVDLFDAIFEVYYVLKAVATNPIEFGWPEWVWKITMDVWDIVIKLFQSSSSKYGTHWLYEPLNPILTQVNNVTYSSILNITTPNKKRHPETFRNRLPIQDSIQL